MSFARPRLLESIAATGLQPAYRLDTKMAVVSTNNLMPIPLYTYSGILI